MISASNIITSGFFDNVKTIAVVGVSDRKTKFGGAAYRELKLRGFDVYALHPSLDTFDGARCYRTPSDLPVVADCALVTIRPAQAVGAVRQIADRGISKVWFQRGTDFSEAVTLAEQIGLQTVSGRCILMYAGQVTGVHKFHRFLGRMFGKY